MKHAILLMMTLAATCQAMAATIQCTGKIKPVTVIIETTEHVLMPFGKFEYKVDGKVVATSFSVGGISADKAYSTHTLTYNFKVLKKTLVTKKNSELRIQIVQTGTSDVQFPFVVHSDATAELKTIEGHKSNMIDQLVCVNQ